MTNENLHWSAAWAIHSPCAEGLKFAESMESIDEFWRTCQRGDWMLWMLGKTCGDDRRQLVLAACACARLALPHVAAGDTRPLVAIETAERWARGEAGVTLADVRNANAAYAAYAANAAAYAANAAAYAADAAAYAADAAAYAADAAANAANAANAADAAAAAANAAYAANAANAAAAAAAAAARNKTLAACADIVREFFPEPPKIGGAK